MKRSFLPSTTGILVVFTVQGQFVLWEVNEKWNTMSEWSVGQPIVTPNTVEPKSPGYGDTGQIGPTLR